MHLTRNYKIYSTMVQNTNYRCNRFLENGKIKTDFYVKPTDTYQYFHFSSCHPYHSKKTITYSQMLRYNRVSPDSRSFDRRCNDLERLLVEGSYKEKEVRKQVGKSLKN